MKTARSALPVAEIQESLAELDVDGWLLWDFRGQNPTAVDALGFEGHLLTRRWAYLVPRAGEPLLLVHAIEAGSIPPTPGKVETYAGYRELHRRLSALLAGRRRVAMEYCPLGSIPYLSRVDAGTVELVRSFGVEVVSSADLVQRFLCRLSTGQVDSHRRAAAAIDRAKEEAFRFVGDRIRAGRPALETEVQALLLREFAESGLVTDHPPIVAVDAHAADPHFVPRAEIASPCGPDSLVLIDLWAKENDPAAVFADVTWMAYAGSAPPRRISQAFEAVVGARDLGIETVTRHHARGTRLEGWMVDRAVRNFLGERGYGERFLHRTGHNIAARAVHGDGANLDDWETHDTRELVDGLCFSIEPGVYFEDFGVRSEIDVVLRAEGPRIYTPAQRELVRILP